MGSSSLLGRFTGKFADSAGSNPLLDRFTGASVGCVVLSGVRKGITISKLFNFSLRGKSTIKSNSSLSLLISLCTIRTLGVPYRCSPKRFKSIVPPFVSSLKSMTLNLIVVYKFST